MTILPEDREHPCACGSCGCFENLVRPGAVLSLAAGFAGTYPAGSDAELLAEQAAAGQCSAADIFRAADLGNIMAQQVTGRLADYHAILIRNVMLFCDPEIITISGLYGSAGLCFARQLKARVQASPFFDIPSMPEISYLRDDSVKSSQTGAALYAEDRYFEKMEI